MPLASDLCICLRKFEYSETSQILTLIGRQRGIVRVIAKGAHRKTKAGASKFDGGIDLMDLGQAVMSIDPAREMGTLTEWKLTGAPRELRASLRAIYLGLSACEIVATLIEEHDPHPDAFDLLSTSLNELRAERVEQTYLAFVIDLLEAAGYLPELTACVSCGKPVADQQRISFSPRRGGVVCADCETPITDRMTIDARLLRLMRGIVQLPRVEGRRIRLPLVTRHQTDPINRILIEHIENIAGKRLRTSRYILSRTKPVDRKVESNK
jgi:DNA repair protein RecO (recombination protein O)